MALEPSRQDLPARWERAYCQHHLGTTTPYLMGGISLPAVKSRPAAPFPRRFSATALRSQLSVRHARCRAATPGNKRPGPRPARAGRA